MNEYFSDRERGPRAQVNDEIDERLWNGIWALIRSRIEDGSFGNRFPKQCEDGGGIYSSDEDKFKDSVMSEIPDITFPDAFYNKPDNYAILDLIEFCFNNIAEPIVIDYHKFFGHNHYMFNTESGQAKFVQDINRIFARNGIAYELDQGGKIKRILHPVIGDEIIKTIFNTGDDELDNLLEEARKRFLDKKPDSRKYAIEKLWDAFERLKTLEHVDKRTSIKMMLDKVSSEPNFKARIEFEAKELTDIGNKFQIRHYETGKIKINNDEHIEYLFYRLFTFILLVMRSTGRLK